MDAGLPIMVVGNDGGGEHRTLSQSSGGRPCSADSDASDERIIPGHMS
jgi:hypothetical protein